MTGAIDDLQKLLMSQEELHPDLEKYHEISDQGFPMIRHPLVYSVIHSPQMNALANERLRLKREAVVKAREDKEWYTYVFLHERPYRINAFVNCAWQLTDRAYWELLGSLWTDAENIWQNYDTWVEALAAGRRHRTSMMDDAERALRKIMPVEFTIYRGFSGLGSKEGLSWTTNQVVAKFFARRYAARDDHMYVAKGTVRRYHVIALFQGRSEDEVVVLPEKVKNVEVYPVRKSAG